MEAARAGGTLTEAATAALTAGCDMVLICNQPDEAEKVLDRLTFVQTKASQTRLRRMRPRGRAWRWGKLMAQVEYQQALALVKSALG
jgi:beta-N-acetylhexosaminidase